MSEIFYYISRPYLGCKEMVLSLIGYPGETVPGMLRDVPFTGTGGT